jgi:hypothetical protein
MGHGTIHSSFNLDGSICLSEKVPGSLPGGGGYCMTLVSPDLKYFTVIVVKISRDHAECTRKSLWNWDTEKELFQLKIDMPEISIDMGTNGGQMQTW